MDWDPREVYLDEIMMSDEEYIEHYGTPRHSGRYPWGSGENPYQRYADFLGNYHKLKDKGMSQTEIAKSMGMSTTVLRAKISYATDSLRQEQVNFAQKLKDKGYSNPAIAKRMGLPSESSVRSLLKEKSNTRSKQTQELMTVLKNTVEDGKYVDVGGGCELRLNVSEQKLKNACKLLEDEGYKITTFRTQQAGTPYKTTVKVLTKADVPRSEINQHRGDIVIPNYYSEDHGFTMKKIEKPVPIDASRIMIRYADDPESGKDRDGTIELRRGVEDLDLHNALYAQVRISVKQDPKAEEGTHYLKGMALYSPDQSKMPPGVDVIFNTNKPRGTDIFGASSDTSVLKPIKADADPTNPFGATIKEDEYLIRAQRHYTGKDGKEHLSALNIVNEEGNWGEWSKTLSSQFLGKQQTSLIRSQLKEAYDIRKEEFDEIGMMTNPAVRKKLYASFADDCDAAAVHLKGASMPRQKTCVILPMPWLKENECYAPLCKDGETVVLIRHPHAGLFEIPELKVNNRDEKAKGMLRNNERPGVPDAMDAIGIHPKTAEKLSGADFDGDTVLVIPNDDHRVQSRPQLESLRLFDPSMYQLPPSAPKVDKAHGFNKQREMGDISNLITDMTIKGADLEEIARAVKHSMVVIDAEKHHYDWRKSAIDNGISELKTKYQGGPKAGASTLLSRAKGQAHPLDRKLLTNPSLMTPEQRERFYNGEKIYVDTGKTHTDRKTGKEVLSTINSTKMAEAKDAFELSSGTIQETIYANFANRLKTLANEARKAALFTQPDKYSPSAKKTYAKEVDSLSKKLYLAELNRPLERKAQLLMAQKLRAYKQANPDMDGDEIRKLRGRLIKECREIVGAGKAPVEITKREWEAIQAHAVSYNTLTKILNNSDMDQIKQLSMPRSSPVMSNAKITRARSMLNQGRTTEEVAEALDVSISTLNKALL